MPTREELKNKEMICRIMLDGLDGVTKETVKNYLMEIDYDKVKNDRTLQTAAPVVRIIITQIMGGKDNKLTIGWYSRVDVYDLADIRDKLIANVRVNDIIERLDDMNEHCLPVVEKYFSAIDAQAELSVLFCQNYLNELLNKIKNE